MAGHDTNLAFPWSNDSWTVGTDQTGCFFLQKLPDLDHVLDRNPLRDTDHQFDACGGGLHDSVGGKGRRNENRTGIWLLGGDCVCYGIEDWNVLMPGTPFSGRHTSYHLSAILPALEGVKGPFFPGQPLDQQASRTTNPN